jgi:adenosylhomocysteine nucleosidase
MTSELRPLVRQARLSPRQVGDLAVHEGQVGATEVSATLAGIGVERSAAVTERVLDALDPDHLVVCGIAGGLGPSTRVGDLIVPATVVDHHTGDSFDASPLGGRERTGTIVTSGELIEDHEVFTSLVDAGCTGIDMETAAVARVCADRQVPWTAFRSISDLATDGLDSEILALVDTDGRPVARNVLRFAATRPGRLSDLVKLSRGASLAARTAAAATLAACREAAGGQ